MHSNLICFQVLILLLFFLLTVSDTFPDDSHTHIIKPSTDTKSYKYIKLPNNLRAILVSDPNAKLSAASLQVLVGGASDPYDFPGLAHFLEHMLFMGSAKYKDPDTFFNYVQANSGEANAFTDFENTNYFFQIPTDRFEQALDIFSDFFVDPCRCLPTL